MRVFLSYSFSKDEDRPLVSEIEDVVRSHGIGLETGRNLGGKALTPELQRRILSCNGLIALASQREQVDGKWRTHPWVHDEVQFARANQRPTMVLFETDVEFDAGFYQENEYAKFERTALTPALLKLSKTLGIWLDSFGRPLKVELHPRDVVKDLGAIQCKVRFYDGGTALAWRDVEPVLEEGG